MNLALILVILSAVTGLVYLIDVIFLKARRKGDQPSKFVEFCRSFFPVFFIVLLLRSFLFEPFRIPTGSLEPTLHVGDFLVANKFSYGIRLPVWEKKVFSVNNPKTGEIALFRWPPDPSYNYIKRVIGVPGDKIEYRNKQLTINGETVPLVFVENTIDESSKHLVKKYRENLNGVEHDIFIRPEVKAQDFSITVPTGHYFMMGDNRDDSADSRYWGFVSEEYLKGKAMFIWMSWDGNTDRVRWNRIGKVIR